MSQKEKLYHWAITDVRLYDDALLSECYELFSDGADVVSDWKQLGALRSLAIKIKEVLLRESNKSWVYKAVDGKSDTYFDCMRQILVTVLKKFFQVVRQELAIDEVVKACQFLRREAILDVLLEKNRSRGVYFKNLIIAYKNALSDAGVLNRSKLVCCESVRERLCQIGDYSDVVRVLDAHIKEKREVAQALVSHDFLDCYNPRVLLSAKPPIDSIVDRICFWKNEGTNLFQFVNVQNGFMSPDGFCDQPCVLMDCFLSLESDVPFDLSVFRMFKLRSENNYLFDGVRSQRISLLNGDPSNGQELQLQRREMIQSIKAAVDLGVASACYTQTHGVETCGLAAHDVRTDAEKTGGRSSTLGWALIPTSKGAVMGASLGQYRLMCFKDCFDYSTGFVHSRVVNIDLGDSGIGDKYLLLTEDAYAGKGSQRVFVRWRVYASNTLLKRAIDKFIGDSLPIDGKPSYLDFRKDCFVRISSDQYDSERISRKKPIVGRLAQEGCVLGSFLPNEFKNILSELAEERDDPELELDPEKICRLEAMISEAKARAEAEQKSREEAEAKRLAEEQRRREEEQRLERERRAKEEAERKAKEEAEAKARAEAEQKSREEAEAKRLAEEQRRREEEQRLEQERRAKEEAEAKARTEEGVRGQDIINWVNKTHARTPLKRAKGKRNIDPNKVYKTSEGMTDIGCRAFEALMKK